jgi:hypothetical protein
LTRFDQRLQRRHRAVTLPAFGAGKTRLLETLFDPRVGDQHLDPALALYVDIGHDAPQPSPGQLIAEGKRTILLMDNCPRETHDAIAAVCKSQGTPPSLITVDLDIRDDRPEDTDVFRLQNALEAVIESLLIRRYPALSQAVRRRIAEFSDGNARIAILIAQLDTCAVDRQFSTPTGGLAAWGASRS